MSMYVSYSGSKVLLVELKEVPEWAKWKAMDKDGIWNFYNNKPELHRPLGLWIYGNNWSDIKSLKFIDPDNSNIDWDKSLVEL